MQTSFRDYKVTAFHRAPLDVGNGGTAEQIKRFLAAHSEAGDTILSALPGDRVTWRTFFLPFRDTKKLAQTVPFELESSVPFGLDEVVVDYQILHRDRAGTTVLAALVQKEDLERHLELLQQSGADPKIVDIGPLAALNTLTLVPDLPPTFVFVDFAPHATTVALYRERELAGLRTLTPLRVAAGRDRQRQRRRRSRSTAAARDALDVAEPGGRRALDAAGAQRRAARRRDGLLRRRRPGDRRRRRASAGRRRCRPTCAGSTGCALRNLGPDVGAQAPAFSSSLGLALREVSPSNTPRRQLPPRRVHLPPRPAGAAPGGPQRRHPRPGRASR